MNRINIVFGTGPLGYWVMKFLSDQGNKVTLVSRTGKTHHELPEGVEIKSANSKNTDEVYNICKDADAVYYCAMPPYTDWPNNFSDMIKGLIEGVAKTNAKIIFGDNLYMYGSTNGQPINESLPYNAPGHKGKVRSQIANMLLDAHKEGKVKTTMGRASDFYGPKVINASFGEMFYKPALEGKTVNMLGDISLPHTFTYIKDFAKALITLGESDKSFGRAWHVPSAKTISQKEMVEIIEKEIGKTIKVRPAGKFMVSLLGMFNPMIKEVKEMMYSTTEPYIVDHSDFEKTFGANITTHEEAVKETVEWFKKNL
ncbi:MAG: NAD-dependent epimerase/dehydratase family protein [Melioribacteraceae bacterium]